MYCPSPAWGLSPSWVLMVPGRPGPGLEAQPCPRLPGRHMRGTCAGTVPRRVADSANGPLPQQEPRSRALPDGTRGVTAARSQGGQAFPWTLPSSEPQHRAGGFVAHSENCVLQETALPDPALTQSDSSSPISKAVYPSLRGDHPKLLVKACSLKPF